MTTSSSAAWAVDAVERSRRREPRREARFHAHGPSRLSRRRLVFSVMGGETVEDALTFQNEERDAAVVLPRSWLGTQSSAGVRL